MRPTQPLRRRCGARRQHGSVAGMPLRRASASERAALLEMRGDFDRALDHFRWATQLAPGLDAARQGYATARLREGRFDEGWREFDRGRERRRIRAQLPAVPAEFLWDGTADLAG